MHLVVVLPNMNNSSKMEHMTQHHNRFFSCTFIKRSYNARQEVSLMGSLRVGVHDWRAAG